MTDDYRFFATAPRGVEPLLAGELTALELAGVEPGRGGVAFSGGMEAGYRACLWSRTAVRVLLPLARFPAPDAEALYQGTLALPWEDHLSPDATLAVDFAGSSAAIVNSHFGALRVKDAVVDRLRRVYQRRPGVDRERPALRINAYLHREQLSLAVDLSGEPLHRRGYREDTVAAPLKENLAAALLLKAGWPTDDGGPLVDPMCGSGTFLVEGGWLALDIAPGLLRDYWGFDGWLGHVPRLWQRLVVEARERRAVGLARSGPLLWGFDQDPRAIRAARTNLERAGLDRYVRLERRELADARPPDGPPGLIMTNPPYGERLGEAAEVEALYPRLGDWLKAHCRGWRGAVFTSNPDLGKRMGLKASRTNVFYNGPLEAKLLQFDIQPEAFVDRDRLARQARDRLLEEARREGEPFANRLRKNLRTLGRWARREDIPCYRLYDADIPEFAVAVDLYHQWVHVQEYRAPRSVDPALAARRLEWIMALLPEVLEVPPENLFLKVRRRRSEREQYGKHAETGEFHEVREGTARLWVNFRDYLDTGLFLDHRPIRQRLGEQAGGQRFLNLFGYTGTATVQAALGGAAATTTVDLSRTYLDWARRNLELNGLTGPRHRLIQADCREWLNRARETYDLIFLDPPSHSVSKRMEEELDIQRDHPGLIRQAARLLAPGGLLVFSTNLRGFELDREALAGLTVEDITPRTLPRDFQRRPDIHRCYEVRRGN